MKLSKKRSTKRSYRKASPKKRASYRKKASPKKRVSPKKRTSYRKKRSTHRRPRISFRFGDDVDPRSVTRASVDQADTDIERRLIELDPLLNPEKRGMIVRKMELIGNKYFTEDVSSDDFTNGGDGLYGNDAIEFVSEKLYITPARLIGIMPNIKDLEYEEVTPEKIKLLFLAYYNRELNDYLDSIKY